MKEIIIILLFLFLMALHSKVRFDLTQAVHRKTVNSVIRKTSLSAVYPLYTLCIPSVKNSQEIRADKLSYFAFAFAFAFALSHSLYPRLCLTRIPR